MTEAADAKPEEGWYVVDTPDGQTTALRYLSANGWPHWRFVDEAKLPLCLQFQQALPPGWTLGPAIADLLREAAWYRWIVNPEGDWANRMDDIYAACNWRPTAEQVDALIDAEMARERKPENG